MQKYLVWSFIFFFITLGFAGTYHETIQYIFPLPESRLLSPETTIILKLHNSYLDQIKNIDNLIHVTGNNGEYSGKNFFSTDEQTIIFKPNRDFRQGEEITVTIRTSQFYENDFEYKFEIAANASNRIDGLLKEQYPAVDAAVRNRGSTDIRLINGVAVPSDFPEIETKQYGSTAPGLVFYSSNFRSEGTGNYLIACQNDGTPYMYKRFAGVGNSANFVLHPTGVLSAYFFHPAHHVVLNENLDIIDVYDPGHGYRGDDHELVILENGHALMISEQHVRIDMSKIVPGGNPNANVQGNMFQEFDKDKNVIFEWRTWDHYRLQDAIGINLREGNIDYVHMNSVSLDYDGHYIISSRHLNEVTKINRNTGEMIWRFGGAHNQFDFINDDLRFSWQHHVRAIKDKPGHYTLFDNGNKRNPNYSRAVEYKLDTSAMTAEKVWEYRYKPDKHSGMMGSVQRLPNGNTFIDWSTTPPVHACEVTPDGKMVFELFSYGASTYRAHRFQWHGMFDKPHLIVENLGYIVNLIFNKFGDTNVNYYNVYHGTTANNFTLLDSTKNTYYQFVYPENNSDHYFKVAAVDKNGEESRFSETRQTFVNYVKPGENIVKNGEFESGQHWQIVRDDNAKASGYISPEDGFTVQIQEPGEQMSDIQLRQTGLTLIQDKEYLLEFDAFAESNRLFYLRVEKNSQPFNDYAQIGAVSVSSARKKYSFTFTMKHNTDSNARLAFRCGKFEQDITFDNVCLKEVDPHLAVNQLSEPVMNTARLLTNYPNPFNSLTRFRYILEKDARVTLTVFNPTGQTVKRLVNCFQPAGQYEIDFSGKNLPSGVYFYRLNAGNCSETKKFLLLR